MYEEGPGYKIASAYEKPLLTRLFKGENKYITILIILLILVFAGFIFLYQNKNTSFQNLAENNNQQQQISPQPTPTIDPKAKEAFEKVERELNIISYNKQAYQDNAQKFADPQHQLSDSRIHVKLLQTKQSDNGFALFVEGITQSKAGKQMWYSYPQQLLPKIKIISSAPYDNPATLSDFQTITIAQLQTGDQLYIDQVIDYSKSYPDSIEKITITKIVGQ